MKIHDVSIKKPRIEMMPLIDSFFLILVYFIYAFMSMSVHKGVPLVLPQASTSIEQKNEHVGISITEDGTIFLNKKMVTTEELSRRLVILKPFFENKNNHLYIYGDKAAAHGRVIEVFDLVRKAGITKVFIETEKK